MASHSRKFLFLTLQCLILFSIPHNSVTKNVHRYTISNCQCSPWLQLTQSNKNHFIPFLVCSMYIYSDIQTFISYYTIFQWFPCLCYSFPLRVMPSFFTFMSNYQGTWHEHVKVCLYTDWQTVTNQNKQYKSFFFNGKQHTACLVSS
jgi:hypothetical protein